MNKKTVFRFVVPIAISIGVIYLFFRDISPGDIYENFLKIPTSYLLLFVVLSMTATILRAVKYHILLSRKISFKDVFLITLVRNFSVDLLPARTASLVLYSWLTNKKGIKIEEGASSFVVSMFYDALALACMLGGLVFFIDTDINKWAMYTGMGIIFAISATAIFFADFFTGLALKISLINRFEKLKKTIQTIDDYLKAHKKNSERLIMFGLSLAIRLLKYVFVFILFEGVVRIGFGIENFSLFCFGLAGTELSSLLPIQGLGGFGTWELAFTYIFQALQIPAGNIKEAGFVIHITTQVFEYSIGLLAFLYLSIKKNLPRTDTNTRL